MLLMVEQGIRRRICHDINQFVKANNKYMKHYDTNKESFFKNQNYLKYWDIIKLYGQCH